jgi:manganese transport protein
MAGLLKLHIPLVVRRGVTLIPALIVLGVGADPTAALVISQVALSFGIPFALIPLVALASSKRLMGEFANAAWLRWAGWISTAAIVLINVLLIGLVIRGL